MTLFTMAIIDAFFSNIWVDFYSATFKKINFYLEGFPLSFLSPILQGVVSSFFLSSHKKNPPHTYLPNHPDPAPTCAHPPPPPYTPPPPNRLRPLLDSLSWVPALAVWRYTSLYPSPPLLLLLILGYSAVSHPSFNSHKVM